MEGFGVLLRCNSGCILTRPNFLLSYQCKEYLEMRYHFSYTPIKRDLNFSRSLFSRDDWIRTSDPVVPNDVRYRAALHPALSWC